MTTEEKQDIVQEVVNVLVTQSTSLDEIQVVNTLDTADSLPAYKRGTSDLVRVPIPLISKPAIDAAAAATTAKEAAELATNNAIVAKNNADTATTNADAATGRANDAASRVNQAMDNINTIKTTAERADGVSARNAEKLGGMSIKSITTQAYEGLQEKDDSTIYFCYEVEDEPTTPTT